MSHLSSSPHPTASVAEKISNNLSLRHVIHCRDILKTFWLKHTVTLYFFYMARIAMFLKSFLFLTAVRTCSRWTWGRWDWFANKSDSFEEAQAPLIPPLLDPLDYNYSDKMHGNSQTIVQIRFHQDTPKKCLACKKNESKDDGSNLLVYWWAIYDRLYLSCFQKTFCIAVTAFLFLGT